MAPAIEYGPFHSDKGLNIFGTQICPPIVEDWFDRIKHKMPVTVTAEMLNQALPDVPQFLRIVARRKLLEGMSIGDSSNDQNPELKQAINDIMPRRITGIGSVFKEDWDGGQSTNWGIPLETDKGIIEIILNNAAGGVGWRLRADNPNKKLIRKYPQLTRVLNPDIAEGRKGLIIPPGELAKFTDKYIDLGEVAESFRAILENIMSSNDQVRYSFTSSSVYLPDNRFYGVNISNGSYNLNLIAGIDSGLRVVDPWFGYLPEELSGLGGNVCNVITLLNTVPRRSR